MVGALKSCCIYTVWVFPEQFKRLCLHYLPVGIQTLTVLYLAVGDSNFICRKPISFTIRSCLLVFLYYGIWWGRSCVRSFSKHWKTLVNASLSFLLSRLNTLIFSLLMSSGKLQKMKLICKSLWLPFRSPFQTFLLQISSGPGTWK